jgi:hypothetical protein
MGEAPQGGAGLLYLNPIVGGLSVGFLRLANGGIASAISVSEIMHVNA